MTKTSLPMKPWIEPTSTPIQVYKLPVPVIANQMLEDRIIDTREGPVQGHDGDWLLTGVEGEQWPLPIERFEATYERSTNVTHAPNVYIKRMQIVQAQTLPGPAKVMTSWGAELDGKAGDWLITAGPEDHWVIQDSIFQQTYTLADEAAIQGATVGEGSR